MTVLIDYATATYCILALASIVIFLIGLFLDFPQQPVFHFVSLLTSLSSAFLMWASGEAILIGIAYVFELLAFISFLLVIWGSLNAFRLKRRYDRGY